MAKTPVNVVPPGTASPAIATQASAMVSEREKLLAIMAADRESIKTYNALRTCIKLGKPCAAEEDAWRKAHDELMNLASLA